MTLVQDIKAARDLTFDELDQENDFLVRYLLSDRAAYNINDTRWTGRGPLSLLEWVLLGSLPTDLDMPKSQYDFDALVNFMERVPEHLDRLLQPMYARYRQYWLEIEERRARMKALTGSAYTYLPGVPGPRMSEFD